MRRDATLKSGDAILNWQLQSGRLLNWQLKSGRLLIWQLKSGGAILKCYDAYIKSHDV